MHCQKCGKELAADSKFCRECGTAVSADTGTTSKLPALSEEPTEVAPRGPGFASAVPTPVLPAPAARSRRRWIIPTVVGTVALLAVAAAVLVVALTRGSGSDGTSKLSSALAPVVSADLALDSRLESASSVNQLDEIATAANDLASEVARAQGAVGATDADAQTKTLVSGALAANLDYAQKVQTAIASLTTATADAAGNAAQRTKDAYLSVSGNSPTVAVPAPSSFLAVRQLGTLASEEATKKTGRTATIVAIRSYVRSIDSLLKNSVETRADLSALINEAQNFAFAAELLRQSISASLADDRAIQGLINAYIDGSDPTPFLTQHEDANARASEAKRNFLATYNQLRTRYLRLAPLPSDLSY